MAPDDISTYGYRDYEKTDYNDQRFSGFVIVPHRNTSFSEKLYAMTFQSFPILHNANDGEFVLVL